MSIPRYCSLGLLLCVLLVGCGRESSSPEEVPAVNPGPDGSGAWGHAGERDPLVEKSKTKEHQERIVERMLDVQLDR